MELPFSATERHFLRQVGAAVNEHSQAHPADSAQRTGTSSSGALCASPRGGAGPRSGKLRPAPALPIGPTGCKSAIEAGAGSRSSQLQLAVCHAALPGSVQRHAQAAASPGPGVNRTSPQNSRGQHCSRSRSNNRLACLLWQTFVSTFCHEVEDELQRALPASPGRWRNGVGDRVVSPQFLPAAMPVRRCPNSPSFGVALASTTKRFGLASLRAAGRPLTATSSATPPMDSPPKRKPDQWGSQVETGSTFSAKTSSVWH